MRICRNYMWKYYIVYFFKRDFKIEGTYIISCVQKKISFEHNSRKQKFFPYIPIPYYYLILVYFIYNKKKYIII